MLADDNALSGLRSLSLDDLARYKAVLNESRRICWQHYFPFLLLFSRKDHSEFLIAEESGSICIYWLSQEKTGPKLHLFLLPMPMDTAVLKACLDRCRDFNGSKGAVIRLVDEADIGVVSCLAGAKTLLKCSEYLYDPRFYHSVPGGKKTVNLRYSIRQIEAMGDMEVRPYVEADAAACLALLDEWWELQKGKHECLHYARYTRACLKQAAEFDSRDLFGKVILLNGKVRSFGFAGEMREGLANLFVGYSDHTIKGLNYYMVYQLMRELDGCILANSGKADTPGVQFAKESLCPVSMHNVYRIQQVAA